jgi:large subunit ribosomal protein L15
MQLHQLKPNKKKTGKRIARGGKKGDYSGKGMKGQKSRAGRKLEPPIRGLIKRYHKLRGYKTNPFKEKALVVSLDVLEKNFQEKEVVSPNSLAVKKIVRRSSGRLPLVKILKKGTITKPLTIKKCFVSRTARAEIEKLGGQIE